MRHKMFEDESEFKKIVDRLNIDTDSDPAYQKSLRQKMLSVFNESNNKSQKSTTPFSVVRRIIMRNPVTKLAAAAAIIIAILVGLPFLSSNSSSIVLADVLERIEQTGAFMYKMKMTMTIFANSPRKQQIRGIATISKEYGMKAQVEITDPNIGEAMIHQMYLLLDQKLMITLIPEKKKYMRMELDDKLLASKKKENNDPREMLKQILACKYTELGRSEINGIEVEGFKTTDPDFAAVAVDEIEMTLWVDVKSWLPVLWEMDMKMNEQMTIHGIFYDYQWDIPVFESDFKPVIPADYTSMTDDGYERLGRTGTEKVAQEYVEIIGRKKSIATDHYNRGEAHYFDGEYDQAFSELNKAIEKDPALARAYIARGTAYNDKNEFDLAIADFTRAIEIKPMAAHAYISRGVAYENKDEYDMAIADYNKAIEIDPKVSDVYNCRARAYYHKGEYNKAWKDINKSQALGQNVDSKLLEKLREASGKDG
jgi:tetratricopeptide (TPR) repeat protein